MWPLVRRRYILPVLLLFAHGCDCWYSADRPEPPASSVTALRIVPSTVFVVPGALFVMRARILDAEGGVLPSHPELTWSSGSGLTIQSHAADSAVVKAATLTSGMSLNSTVTAHVGTHSATASITILAPNASGTPDSIMGDNRTGMQPDVVLLDNLSAPQKVDDSLIAYVGVGLLGNLSGGTGEAARLASDQAFYLEPVHWQGTKDVIDMRTPAATGPEPAETRAPIVARFTVWIATPAGGASAKADNDVKYATRVFLREHTGVALGAVRKLANGGGPFLLERNASLECQAIVAKLQALGVPNPATSLAFSKDSLNVVYVDDVELPPTSPEEVSTPAGMPGYTCPPDPIAGTLILISVLRRGSGTLTHELGHALGLHEPDSGHTLLLNGFAYTNMMWNYETDIATAPRSTFSLGQAFRINMDDHSWLHLLTGSTRNCDPTEVDRSCPTLAKDFP